MAGHESNPMHAAAVKMDSPRLEANVHDSIRTDNQCGSTPLVSSKLEDEFMRGLPAFGEAAQNQRISGML
jgi:hypothetical protein